MTNCIKCKTELPDGAAYCFSCGKKQTPTPRKALKRANGLGCVSKLSGRRRKPWMARKNDIFIGTYETKTEALEALAKHMGKTMPERYNYTFEDVYKEWSAEHFRKLKSEKGREGYETAYKKSEPLHTKKFRALVLHDLQGVVDLYQDQSASARNKMKQLYGQMYQWAIREGIVTLNYAQFINIEEAKAKVETVAEKTFSDAEIAILESHDSDPVVRITLILIYSGMRIGELFTMERNNVHLDEGYMVGGEKTESGIDRVIPIHNKIVPYIQSLYDRSKPGELLIRGYEKNRNIHNFRIKDFYPMLERLGLPKRKIHSTRATFATLAVKAKMRPEELKAILGHKSYEVTTKYYVDERRLQLSGAMNSIGASNLVTNPTGISSINGH